MVQARDNSPGFHEFWENRPWTRYEFDSYWGDPQEWHKAGDDFYPRHTCSRSNKVNNPIRLLGPGGPEWRNPSSYDRHICEVNAIRGTWRKEIHGLNYRGQPYTQIDQIDALHRESLFYWHFSESRYSLAGGGPAFPTNEENHALAKAYSKLKDARASMGENLAEAAKTYSTLTREYGNLLYALRAVKRGNFGLAAKWIRDGRGVVRRGADVYLQYKFGWKPLVDDVYGLVGLLQEQCKPALLMYAVGGMPRKTINLLPQSGYERSGSVKMTGHVRLTGKINDSQSSLPDKIGLSNPLSLAWELVPWSFVVDWALPVGSVLDAMTAPMGLDFVGGYASARFSGDFRSKLLTNGWDGFEEISPRVNEYTVFNLMRRKYDNWPYVGLYVKSPFSNSHGITSFALFLQQLLK